MLVKLGSNLPIFFYCRYLRATQVGEEIIIDANTLRAGRTLAFLTVDLKKKSDGSLVAQGKHTKFVGGQ